MADPPKSKQGMTASSPTQRSAMMAAAEAEWQANTDEEREWIDCWH